MLGRGYSGLLKKGLKLARQPTITIHKGEIGLTPFGLHSEKDPHPPPRDLKKHEGEEARLGLSEPDKPRHKPGEPRETNA